MTIRPWHGTIEDSAIQVRHDGRELRIIAGGEDAARIEGSPEQLRTMLSVALDAVYANELDPDEDDDEPAVCVYCGMALSWFGPREGWVGLRWIVDDANGDAISEPDPICRVPHEDGNLHRPITPAERDAREEPAEPTGS